MSAVGNLNEAAPDLGRSLNPPQGDRLLTTLRAATLAHILVRASVRPRLALLLLRSAWRFRARGWYRRAPFLPLPSAEYIEWRLHTAYGEEGAEPTVDELRHYLEWTEAMRRRGRSGRGKGR